MRYIARNLEKVVLEVTKEYPVAGDRAKAGRKNYDAAKVDGRNRQKLRIVR